MLRRKRVSDLEISMSDDGKQWLLMMLVSVLAVAVVSGGAVVLFELRR
jgi:hypothetical protein